MRVMVLIGMALAAGWLYAGDLSPVQSANAALAQIQECLGLGIKHRASLADMSSITRGDGGLQPGVGRERRRA